MRTKPETRIRQLKQISTAIKNLAGHTAWSHFWNVPAPENPTSGMHDDDFYEFQFDHRYEWAKAIDSPQAAPLTLTKHDLHLFETSVSIVLEVLSLAFLLPGLRIMREVRARFAEAGRAQKVVRMGAIACVALTTAMADEQFAAFSRL